MTALLGNLAAITPGVAIILAEGAVVGAIAAIIVLVANRRGVKG